MLERLRARFEKFQRAEPGTRFVRHYEESHKGGKKAGKRFLRLIGGMAVVVVGLVLMPAPGPGIVVVIVGLGLVAEQSLTTARLLDAFDLRFRWIAARLASLWRRAPVALKAVYVLVLAAGMVGAGFLAYRLIVG
jgi:hypothetical protein